MAGSPPPIDTLPQHVYRWLEAAERRVAAELDSVAGDDVKRVGYRRLRILQFIDPDGTRQQELAERAQMTKQAMADFIDDLEADGLVERTPDPTDGPAWRIVRTKAGDDLNVELNAAIWTAELHLSRVVGAKRYAVFMDVLRDLGRDQIKP